VSGVGPGQSVWLFTSEAHSVRLHIEPGPSGVRIVVSGPGSETAHFDFADMDNLERFRQLLERDLITRGFQIQAVAERRRADQAAGRPDAMPERRRMNR
jgi:hypothetical protein